VYLLGKEGLSDQLLAALLLLLERALEATRELCLCGLGPLAGRGEAANVVLLGVPMVKLLEDDLHDVEVLLLELCW